MSNLLNGGASPTDGSIQAIQSQIVAAGTPYGSPYAGLGLPPSVIPDLPLSIVFLVIFVACSASNVFIFVTNKKKGHKFGFSMAFNAFCVIRTISCSLRAAWAVYPDNAKLALAAQIFVYCGTIILYIVDLFLAQRLMRARHPKLGWSPLFTIVCPPLVVAATVITVILVIIAVLQMSYTRDPNILRIDGDIQIYVETAFMVFAFLPFLICCLVLVLPRKTYLDKFGAGRFRTKILILSSASLLLTLGAGWRCAISWVPEVPRTESPWYLSKTCFYIFNFTIEAIVLILYLVTRVDRRFYTPDGAKGPFSYSGDVVGTEADRASITKEMDARVGPWGNSFYLPTFDRRRGDLPTQSTEGILADIPEDASASSLTLATDMQNRWSYQSLNQSLYQLPPQQSSHTLPYGLHPQRQGPHPPPTHPGESVYTLTDTRKSDDTRKMSMMSGISSGGSSFLELDAKTGKWRLRESTEPLDETEAVYGGAAADENRLLAPQPHPTYPPAQRQSAGHLQLPPMAARMSQVALARANEYPGFSGNASMWGLSGGSSLAPSEYARSEKTTRTF